MTNFVFRADSFFLGWLPLLIGASLASFSATGEQVTGHSPVTRSAVTQFLGLAPRRSANKTPSPEPALNKDGFFFGDQGRTVVFEKMVDGKLVCKAWLYCGVEPLSIRNLLSCDLRIVSQETGESLTVRRNMHQMIAGEGRVQFPAAGLFPSPSTGYIQRDGSGTFSVVAELTSQGLLKSSKKVTACNEMSYSGSFSSPAAYRRMPEYQFAQSNSIAR